MPARNVPPRGMNDARVILHIKKEYPRHRYGNDQTDRLANIFHDHRFLSQPGNSFLHGGGGGVKAVKETVSSSFYFQVSLFLQS